MASSLLYKRGMKDDKGEWDDSKLIAAYDKAMIAAKEQAKKKAVLSMNGRIKPRKKKNWKIRDYCLAPYAEDGLLYEAQILEIDEANNVCIVQYLGYCNEDEVSLDDLARSQGKFSRKKQIEACQLTVSQWLVGDFCRAPYSEDGLMYEAVVMDIYDDETCLVKYTNYENEEVVPLNELDPVLGNPPKQRESESASCSASLQEQVSVVDEVASVYSSEPSSMTASDHDATSSPAHRRPAHVKPEVDGRRRCRSSHERPRNLPYDHHFMPPSHHLPSPMNGDVSSLDDDLGSMLIAWYMAGYHTGYYQGRHARAESENRCRRFRDFH